MTTIAATVIADSIGRDAPRLTTLHLRYPRFIHAELMTHRVFSRNARSSRAVPITRMIGEVVNDPVTPLHWGAAQAGMQAHVELEGDALAEAQRAWEGARVAAAAYARALARVGAHKQLANRILEPFLHIDVLVTATEWANFLALRDHSAAEPHMRLLARAVRAAIDGSAPEQRGLDDWHLPYVGDDDRAEMAWCERELRLVSAARCARISYRAHDGGTVEVGEDLRLARQLAASGHWSPFEHQAQPDTACDAGGCHRWSNPGTHGNLIGWRQHRKMFPGEAGPDA